MNSTISVIMPLYNCEKYIIESMNSVILQTYPHWELLIIDDCSTDNSYQLVKETITNNPQIHLYKLPRNQGVAYARNYGIDHAKGRYIAFLDSDDKWFPDKLMKQINFMIQNNLALTFSSYNIIDENDTYLCTVAAPKNITFYDELKGNGIGNLTAIFDTQVIGKKKFQSIGHEDYLYWLEILKEIHKTQGMEDILAEYRVSKDSISSNKIKAALWTWKIYRTSLQLSIVKSTYYFSFYIIKSLIKYSRLALAK